jgi:hypothetical protein
LPTVKIPPAPFTKGGDILAFTKGGDILAFTKGGDIRDFAKGGDIWGMFSALLLNYCHKKARTSPCAFARDILVAAIRIRFLRLAI